MKKNEFFEYIITLIDKHKHPVEYKNPDFTILLEISNDLLCFTVLEKYYQFRLYNLLTLSKSDEELKLEKEKLMRLQNSADEKKLKAELQNEKQLNLIDELEKIKNENQHEQNLSLNEDDINAVKNEDEKDESDVDLI